MESIQYVVPKDASGHWMYILMDRDVVVYVGITSGRYFDRVKHHAEKEYTHAILVNHPNRESAKFSEREYIRFFKPKYNVQLVSAETKLPSIIMAHIPPPAQENTNHMMGAKESSYDLIRSDRAASILGITEQALRVWRLKGKGPKFIKIGSAVRYRVSDVHDYITEKTHRNTCYEVRTGLGGLPVKVMV